MPLSENQLSEASAAIKPVLSKDQISEAMGSINLAPQFDAASTPEGLSSLQEARDMSWPEAMFKSALNEGTELFTTSRKQFNQAMLGKDKGELYNARENQKRRDEFAPIANENPVSTFTGSIAPYIYPGARLYKGIESVGKSLLKTKPVLGNRLLTPGALGATTGAIEGGAVAAGKDQNIPLGATLGGAFGKLGGDFGAWATKTPNRLTDRMKESVDTAKQWGMKLFPGAKTNIKKLQIKDAAMASGSKTSDVADAVNDYNNKILSGKVLSVAGINADNASTKVIQDAFKEYSKGFNALIRRSDADIDNKLIDDFYGAIKEFDQLRLGEPSKLLNSYKKKFHKSIRNSETVSGQDFQRFYSDITNTINARKKLANPSEEVQAETNALIGMRNAVDDRVERNLSPIDRGKAKELRTKYAAMKLFQEGDVLDRASGRVDPVKLDTILNKPRNRQSYAIERGAFEDLHKAAKIGNYLKSQPGSNLQDPQMLSKSLKKVGEDEVNFRQYLKGNQELSILEAAQDTLYKAGYPDLTGGLFLPESVLPYLQSYGTTTGIDTMKGIYGDPNSGIQKTFNLLTGESK